MSILLNTIKVGLSALLISSKILFTESICSSKLGCEISITCNSKSASLTSSKVDLNDSTNCVGNFLIKPTVSDNKNGIFLITTFLTVVSSVAKSLFSAKTLLLLTTFINVDLPTLV